VEFKPAVPDHSFSGTEGVFTDFPLHERLISPRQQSWLRTGINMQKVLSCGTWRHVVMVTTGLPEELPVFVLRTGD